MKNNSATLKVIILVIIAATLGYLILNQNSSGNKAQSSSAENNSSQEQSAPSPETDVLIFPADDATQEVKDKHFQLVLDKAAQTDKVTIKNCQGDPVVAQVPHQSQLKVENLDDKDHTLEVTASKDHVYQVKAKATTEIKVDFINGPGVYRYVCDKGGETAGIFFVAP